MLLVRGRVPKYWGRLKCPSPCPTDYFPGTEDSNTHEMWSSDLYVCGCKTLWEMLSNGTEGFKKTFVFFLKMASNRIGVFLSQFIVRLFASNSFFFATKTGMHIIGFSQASFFSHWTFWNASFNCVSVFLASTECLWKTNPALLTIWHCCVQWFNSVFCF